MRLRDYQQDSAVEVLVALESNDSTLLVLPTGTGKTVVFAKLIDQILANNPGKRAIVMAHRDELITQACDKIGRATGLSTEIEKADQYAAGMSSLYKPSDVMVTSVQTQNAGYNGHGRMTRFDPAHFAILVIDEAHHSTAQTYRKVIDYYRKNPDLKVLGVTATPDRADEAALGQIFETVAYEYGINTAIQDGWLVTIVQSSIECESLDFADIKTVAGDLQGSALEAVLTKEGPLQEMIVPAMDIIGDRKTLIFAAGVFHAERMCEIINRYKPGSARYVTGKTPRDERKQMFTDYKHGEFQFLCNVGVATEGFDEPSIEVVMLARPTKSRALFAQMVGRGTRPLDGLVDPHETSELRRQAIVASSKPFIEVVDFVGNCGRHKLIGVVDLLGGEESDAVVERARKLAEEKKNGKPVDVQEAISKARALIEAELEASRRKNIRAKATYRKTTVNPFDLLGLTPVHEKGWDTQAPASEKQMAVLVKMKVPIPSDGFSKRRASQLIGKLFERSHLGLCTFSQKKVLERSGYETKGVTFQRAGELITELKANGWRKPQEASAE